MLGGSWSGGTSDKNAEMFDPAGDKWSLLPGIPATSIYTNDPAGKYRADNHGWFFGWSGGKGAILNSPVDLCISIELGGVRYLLCQDAAQQ